MSDERPLTPQEQQMMAAYAEQMRSLRIEQLVASTVQTALELGFLRSGVEAGTEAGRDLAQCELAVETVRALLPLIERLGGREAANAYRGALSELQLAYARASGAGPPATQPPPPPPPGEPPPVETPPRPKIWTPRGDV